MPWQGPYKVGTSAMQEGPAWVNLKDGGRGGSREAVRKAGPAQPSGCPPITVGITRASSRIQQPDLLGALEGPVQGAPGSPWLLPCCGRRGCNRGSSGDLVVSPCRAHFCPLPVGCLKIAPHLPGPREGPSGWLVLPSLAAGQGLAHLLLPEDQAGGHDDVGLSDKALSLDRTTFTAAWTSHMPRRLSSESLLALRWRGWGGHTPALTEGRIWPVPACTKVPPGLPVTALGQCPIRQQLEGGVGGTGSSAPGWQGSQLL